MHWWSSSIHICFDFTVYNFCQWQIFKKICFLFFFIFITQWCFILIYHDTCIYTSLPQPNPLSSTVDQLVNSPPPFWNLLLGYIYSVPTYTIHLKVDHNNFYSKTSISNFLNFFLTFLMKCIFSLSSPP